MTACLPAEFTRTHNHKRYENQIYSVAFIVTRIILKTTTDWKTESFLLKGTNIIGKINNILLIQFSADLFIHHYNPAAMKFSQWYVLQSVALARWGVEMFMALGFCRWQAECSKCLLKLKILCTKKVTQSEHKSRVATTKIEVHVLWISCAFVYLSALFRRSFVRCKLLKFVEITLVVRV